MNEKNIFYARDNIDTEFPVKIFKLNGKIHQSEHAHEYIQLWYVLNGKCIHFFNKESHTLSKGSIFVLPPYVSHYLISDDDSELIGLEFTEEFISENMDKGANFFNYSYIEPFMVSIDEVKPSFQLEGYEKRCIESLLNEIFMEFRDKENYHELFIKANVLKILAIISRAYDKNINPYKKIIMERYENSINLAIDYINKNYCNKIYLKEVCRISMMSPANFSPVFKQITGSTFTEYVNVLKVKKAKELLLQTDWSIRAVALELGFDNITYFNKLFKNNVGISPSKYREDKNSKA